MDYLWMCVSPFLWHWKGQKFYWLSLAFIIDWRDVLSSLPLSKEIDKTQCFSNFEAAIVQIERVFSGAKSEERIYSKTSEASK